MIIYNITCIKSAETLICDYYANMVEVIYVIENKYNGFAGAVFI